MARDTKTQEPGTQTGSTTRRASSTTNPPARAEASDAPAEPATGTPTAPSGRASAVMRIGQQQAAGALIGAARMFAGLPRKQMVLYAGLGVAALASVIDWPVAIAVAAGTEVARRAGRSNDATRDQSGEPKAVSSS